MVECGPQDLNETKQRQQTMKRILIPIFCATFGAFAIGADVTETTTTTTWGTGTVSEYTPGETFVIKETSGPVTYKYGKKVTYVTKSGKTLTDADVKTRIKVGAPVRVQYASEGDTRIINKVEIDD
jgi:hypothetical protein